MEATGSVSRINSYYYVYGAGSRVNRHISFIREGESSSSLKGRVFARLDGEWIHTSEVSSSEISVDLCSTSQKMDIIMNARKKNESPNFETVNMSEKTILEQNEVLSKLEPEGPLRITIENDVGGPRGLEKVIHLSIFNPS